MSEWEGEASIVLNVPCSVQPGKTAKKGTDPQWNFYNLVPPPKKIPYSCSTFNYYIVHVAYRNSNMTYVSLLPVANEWLPWGYRGHLSKSRKMVRVGWSIYIVVHNRLLVLLLQETFKLLISDVNNSSEVPQWRETDYRQHDVIAADHVFTNINNATTNEHTTSFAVARRGVWIAFRDQVSCYLLTLQLDRCQCQDVKNFQTVRSELYIVV